MEPESSKSMLERRRFERLPWSGSILVVSENDLGVWPARDIGGGGAFVHAPAPPAPGERVRVEFDVGPARRFALPARVLRHEKPGQPGGSPAGYAVCFDVPYDECRALDHALRAETARAGSVGADDLQ